eukprot:TRINITY_DN29611_c0_g1_i1.p1 TRINITY_DN29611_c0_g1~~TRINITY_DN29611_c0_g1_i1.p1  ORF type:complete len:578 (-),score=71.86 TRINITY_DN29611_c0_g1_i1:150-1763(-)
MHEGIHSHPEWYPKLSASSQFEDFQKYLHDQEKDSCSEPCPHRAEAEVPQPALPEVPSAANGVISGPCHNAIPGEKCYDAVKWAQMDGIYGHPDWFRGLTNYSSNEDFQAILAQDPKTFCPRPCFPDYKVSLDVKYRRSPKTIMKGIAYGPSPEMKRGRLIPNDDFTSEHAGLMWASWGRSDLSIMHKIGANTVRLYGNDPRVNKRAFLDEALRQNLDVIVGMSNYPYVQAKDSCHKKDFDCFHHIHESYKENLLNGLTINGHTAYHPAVAAVIVFNEPDLEVHHRTGDCKAVISAFDGMLQAEKELGVKGNPVSFTVTYSIAAKWGAGGTGQMEHLNGCMSEPKKRTGYSPRNPVTEAYRARWLHGYNTPQGSGAQFGLLSKYGSSSMWKQYKIPMFIGEYHAPGANQMYDLPAVFKQTQTRDFLLGFCFFEYQARYDKVGGFGAAYEMRFGMFGLDEHCDLGEIDYFGKKYKIHRVVPRGDASNALMKTFGGTSIGNEPCRKVLASRARPGFNLTSLDISGSMSDLPANITTYAS